MRPLPTRAPVPFLAAFVVALGGTGALDAQEVRGRLLDEAEGTPLAGAYVALVRDDAAAATTLTRADGWFQLEAPEAGTWTVRAEHLGYGTVEIMVNAAPDRPVWLDLAAAREAVEIEGITAEVDRACEVESEDAVALARLWTEVSKAFQVATVAEDRGLYRLEVDQWRRSLDPADLALVEETDRRRGRGNQRGSPFESLPPAALEADGYVQGDDRAGYRYYAPDARVLLSRSFQDTHCFGVEDDEPDELPPGVAPGAWRGIAFEPRDRNEPDVRGVLWIDRRSLEPRRLDFRYTDLPIPVEHDELGGRVGFRRLPEGPWIVSDWRIRMPVVDAEEYRPYASASLRLRHEIVSLTEVGGQVVEVGRRGAETVTFGETGSVEGVVRDADGAPAPDAVVTLAGTFFAAMTDGDGRFVVEGVPPGRYRLAATSAVLDSLGLGGEGSAEVQVRPRGVSEVELELPDVATLMADACAAPLEEGAEGLLAGRLARGRAETEPDFAALRVELSWTSAVDLDMRPGVVGVEVGTARALVPVGADGRWRACGVPVDEPVRVSAVRGDEGREPVSEVRAVTVVRGEIPEVVLPLLAVEAAVGDPVELEGLTVEVARRVRDDLMDIGVRREALGRRFIGTDDIEKNRNSTASALHLVERQRLPGVFFRDGADFQCIALRRASDPSDLGAAGARTQLCAQIVVDGMPVHQSVLQLMRPTDIAAMALLTPLEAGARFGSGVSGHTGAAGGILYIWTYGGVEGSNRRR